jgi:hypothetical protein
MFAVKRLLCVVAVDEAARPEGSSSVGRMKGEIAISELDEV